MFQVSIDQSQHRSLHRNNMKNEIYNKFTHNALIRRNCVEILVILLRFFGFLIKIKLENLFHFLRNGFWICLPRIIIFFIRCMIDRRIVWLRIIEILLNIRLTIADIWLSNSAFDYTIIIAAIIIWHSAATITIMVTTTAHLCDYKKILWVPCWVYVKVLEA